MRLGSFFKVNKPVTEISIQPAFLVQISLKEHWNGVGTSLASEAVSECIKFVV